jgi:hypothetical protein
MNAIPGPFEKDSARAPAERSERGERRRVSLKGFIAFTNGSTSSVSVLDLSYDGCGIETPVALAVDQPIKLSVPGRGAIEATVRWYADGKAGLVFAPEIRKPHVPRKIERMALTAEVRLRRIGGAAYQVSVFDLSPLGCRVEVIEQPREGELMLIKFDGLEALEAEVCWVDGPRAGLRFGKSIHPAVFELLLTRLAG